MLWAYQVLEYRLLKRYQCTSSRVQSLRISLHIIENVGFLLQSNIYLLFCTEFELVKSRQHTARSQTLLSPALTDDSSMTLLQYILVFVHPTLLKNMNYKNVVHTCGDTWCSPLSTMHGKYYALTGSGPGGAPLVAVCQAYVGSEKCLFSDLRMGILWEKIAGYGWPVADVVHFGSHRISIKRHWALQNCFLSILQAASYCSMSCYISATWADCATWYQSSRSTPTPVHTCQHPPTPALK